MYAVVAPNLSAIYINWAEVERVKALYAYPKWCKCSTEEEAREFIRRNSAGYLLQTINKYGDIFPELYVDAKYKIGDNCIYYSFDTKRVGRVIISRPNVVVRYKGDKIFVKFPNIKLSDESISSHMSSIVNLLDVLGDCVDVNIHLPNYSVFYALNIYSGGKSRPVEFARNKIKQRECAVAYTLPIRGMEREDFDE